MSQDQPPHYLGRDPNRSPYPDYSSGQGGPGQWGQGPFQHGYQPPGGQHSQQGRGMAHAQGHRSGSELIPPPPAGHRGLFTVVVLYLVAGFMVLWTGACVAVTIDAVREGDGTQVMVGMFMTAASLAISAGLGAWLIRIHRRRAGYRRILDHHYAQRFGHYPDDM